MKKIFCLILASFCLFAVGCDSTLETSSTAISTEESTPAPTKDPGLSGDVREKLDVAEVNNNYDPGEILKGYLLPEMAVWDKVAELVQIEDEECNMRIKLPATEIGTTPPELTYLGEYEGVKYLPPETNAYITFDFEKGNVLHEYASLILIVGDDAQIASATLSISDYTDRVHFYSKEMEYGSRLLIQLITGMSPEETEELVQHFYVGEKKMYQVQYEDWVIGGYIIDKDGEDSECAVTCYRQL